MRVRLAAATAVCDSLESPLIETPLVPRFPPRNRCEGQHFGVERSSSVTASSELSGATPGRSRASRGANRGSSRLHAPPAPGSRCASKAAKTDGSGVLPWTSTVSGETAAMSSRDHSSSRFWTKSV